MARMARMKRRVVWKKLLLWIIFRLHHCRGNVVEVGDCFGLVTKEEEHQMFCCCATCLSFGFEEY
jgi:hypothetical protein